MRLRTMFATGILAASSLAHADTVYTYTGQPYTFVTPPFTTEDRITGYFTLPEPLVPNLYFLIQIHPTTFSFSDGVQSYSSSDMPFFQQFEFSTDTQGNITGWFIGIGTGSADLEASSNGGDISVIEKYCGLYTIAEMGENRSIGSFAISSTPEPSSFALLGTGLIGVAALLRHRTARPA